MDFRECVDIIIAKEGGYVFRKDDPGGETNFGISRKAYPKEDIKNLTREKAIELYRRDYWDKLGLESLPAEARLMYFDCAVNQGPGRAKQLYDQSKGDVRRFAKLRLDYYADLPSWKVFGKGWAKRLLDIVCLSI